MTLNLGRIDMDARRLVATLALGLLVVLPACASSSGQQSTEPEYNIQRPSDAPPPTGGVPPDKENEINLLLQQREPSARKCYQDVLNEKHDRAFQGTVRVLIAIEPSGKAASVKVVGGTLTDETVQDCLVQTIKEFEFPQLAQAGEVQYEYRFRPAY
jgi:TonB family protein